MSMGIQGFDQKNAKFQVMLSIPKAKLNAASELVKENTAPFHVNREKIKNLPPGTKAKLETFLGNFNTFVLYFDPSLDLSKVPYIIKGIKEMKGSIVPFMKKGITHYVIPNNPLASNKNSDNLSIAKKLGLTIWKISKLEKIIAVCLEMKNEPKPLKEILRDEQIFGPSTSRDRGKKSGKVAFKGNFLLIEENSGKYKPVAVKEFEKETWPTLQFGNAVGKCAFIKESKKVVSEDDKNNESELRDEFRSYRERLVEMLDDKVVNVPEIEGDERFLHLNSVPLQEFQEFVDYAQEKLDLYQKLKRNPTTVFQNSAASGLVSGSVAAQALKRDMSKDPRVAYLGTRVVSLVKESKGKNEVVERCVPGKSFYNRPGYCENCNVKYNRFYEHVRSRQHKHWARYMANFNDLDVLFSEMQRPDNFQVSPEKFSYNSNIDIEALNADIYDSAEEYPFRNDSASIKNPKSCSPSDHESNAIDNEFDEENSENVTIAESYKKRNAQRAEDFIRTQGNQTEPLEAKLSNHSLHLEYNYDDTSCSNLRKESSKGDSHAEDWVPVKITRNRTKLEHIIMNPNEITINENAQKQGLKRSSFALGGSSKKKKIKSKSKRVKKTPVKTIPYSLRGRGKSKK